MNNKKKRGNGLLSANTINAAASGDPGAIRAVLKHYGGYILALSIVRLFDEQGTPYMFVDETLRRELELRLITKVIGFKFKTAA